MEFGVVVFDGVEQFAHLNIGGEFLTDFAAEGLLRRFAGLDFAAGKLPPALPVAIPTLGGEKFSILNDDGSDDGFGFHYNEGIKKLRDEEFKGIRVEFPTG